MNGTLKYCLWHIPAYACGYSIFLMIVAIFIKITQLKVNWAVLSWQALPSRNLHPTIIYDPVYRIQYNAIIENLST